MKEYIVPEHKDVEIDFSWAGIMAFPENNRDAVGKGIFFLLKKWN